MWSPWTTSEQHFDQFFHYLFDICSGTLHGMTPRGGSWIFRGGWPNSKNRDNLAPVAPYGPQSFNWAYWYFGPHFYLYGPDLGPKLALFTTKIRNVLIKHQSRAPWIRP